MIAEAHVFFLVRNLRNESVVPLIARLLLCIAVLLPATGSLQKLGTGLEASISTETHASGALGERPVVVARSQSALLGRLARKINSLLPTGKRGSASPYRIVRRAFGMSAMQFSFELEGRSPRGIVRYYRPENVEDRAWLALSDAQRQSQVDAMGPTPWRHKWLRTSDAPPWLGKSLSFEDDGAVWELSSALFAKTLDEMWSQVLHMSDTTGATDFHFHVSFKPRRRYADEVTSFIAHLDEIHTLQMLNFPPQVRSNRVREAIKAGDLALLESNAARPHLIPHTQDSLSEVRAALRADKQVYEKEHPVGFRTLTYDDPARVGIEFRATDDLGVARALLETTVEFLADPRRAKLNTLESTAPFRIADLMVLDHTSRATLNRIGGRRTRAALEHFAYIGNSAVEVSVDYEPLTWAYPMLRWEDRPHLAHLREQIERARKAYVDEVEKFRARFESEPKALREHRGYADGINYALERFVHNSGIASSF